MPVSPDQIVKDQHLLCKTSFGRSTGALVISGIAGIAGSNIERFTPDAVNFLPIFAKLLANRKVFLCNNSSELLTD